MGDLQISLLVIGAFVVAGVYLFNVMQERRFRRRAEQNFPRHHADVLMQGTAAPVEQAGGRVEPRLDTSPLRAAAVAPPAAADPAMIDPVIDYVVEVDLPAAVESAGLRDTLRGLTADWSKPVQVAGYNPASGEWQPVATGSGGAYSRMRFAVQMTNRAGCVTQGQLTAFRDAVIHRAAANQGGGKCLDVAEAHAMATQLDRFCAEVDIAIGINVVTRDGNPFSGTKIRALAEAAGLRLEADGLFYSRSDAGDVIFTLDNHEPAPFVPEQMKTMFTSGVTFLLDVPRVPAALRAFDTILGMARNFAASLDGMLVDDNRSALSDVAIAKIRQQLENILAKMEAGQIAAGGARALRLFS